jgi:hypothetical protein
MVYGNTSKVEYPGGTIIEQLRSALPCKRLQSEYSGDSFMLQEGIKESVLFYLKHEFIGIGSLLVSNLFTFHSTIPYRLSPVFRFPKTK